MRLLFLQIPLGFPSSFINQTILPRNLHRLNLLGSQFPNILIKICNRLLFIKKNFYQVTLSPIWWYNPHPPDISLEVTHGIPDIPHKILIARTTYKILGLYNQKPKIDQYTMPSLHFLPNCITLFFEDTFNETYSLCFKDMSGLTLQSTYSFYLLNSTNNLSWMNLTFSYFSFIPNFGLFL